MNYRHAYHAGNFADVVKHATLALIVDSLKKKDTAFFALDTHAAIGRYDLWTIQAVKTLEYKDGIERLLAAKIPAALRPMLDSYLGAVRGLNGKLFRFYPGSPLLTQKLMRAQDRLVLAELHPEDFKWLRDEFAADKRVSVHHADGYDALKAFLPPKEKRGFALIDPPFEEKGEYEKLGKALIGAHRKWPQGCLAAWYPIKGRAPIDFLHQTLVHAEIPGLLCVELRLFDSEPEDRLNGCGLVLIAPPWRLDESLRQLLPFLLSVLKREDAGAHRVEWLRPPA